MPPELYAYGDALTPHYTMARYPGKKPFRYTREAGERCIMYAGKIIEWVESQAATVPGGEEEKGE